MVMVNLGTQCGKVIIKVPRKARTGQALPQSGKSQAIARRVAVRHACLLPSKL